MSTAGKYIIRRYDRDGRTLDDIEDYKTLQIIDIANNTGMWKLTSISKNKCPFSPGEVIEVFRNGVSIYNGIFLSYAEEKQFKYNSWKWEASGVNTNQYMKWRLVAPETGDTYPSINWLLTRDFTMSGNVEDIIGTLVNNNMVYGTPHYNRGPLTPGFYLCRGARAQAPFITSQESIISRYDVVYDVISELLYKNNLFILPVNTHDPSMAFDFGIEYLITSGNDLSNNVIFTTENNEIETFRHFVESPDVTHVVASYNSEDSAFGSPDYMWRFAVAKPIPGFNWQIDTGGRETFYKPKLEDFDGHLSRDKLIELCEKKASAYKINSEYYEVELNLIASPYTYGYDYNSQASEFTTDYRLGDKIGIDVDGETFTGRLTGMEFYSAYGKEYIKPTLGEFQKRTFDKITSNLTELNKTTSKNENTGV